MFDFEIPAQDDQLDQDQQDAEKDSELSQSHGEIKTEKISAHKKSTVSISFRTVDFQLITSIGLTSLFT